MQYIAQKNVGLIVEGCPISQGTWGGKPRQKKGDTVYLVQMTQIKQAMGQAKEMKEIPMVSKCIKLNRYAISNACGEQLFFKIIVAWNFNL